MDADTNNYSQNTPLFQGTYSHRSVFVGTCFSILLRLGFSSFQVYLCSTARSTHSSSGFWSWVFQHTELLTRFCARVTYILELVFVHHDRVLQLLLRCVALSQKSLGAYSVLLLALSDLPNSRKPCVSAHKHNAIQFIKKKNSISYWLFLQTQWRDIKPDYHCSASRKNYR